MKSHRPTLPSNHPTPQTPCSKSPTAPALYPRHHPTRKHCPRSIGFSLCSWVLSTIPKVRLSTHTAPPSCRGRLPRRDVCAPDDLPGRGALGFPLHVVADL